MKVFVYYNLHKKTWSIRSVKTRRIIGHADRVLLRGVTFKVSAKGRLRVLREGRKNVHAGVEGWLDSIGTDTILRSANCTVAVTYNPYLYETFVRKDTLEPITSSNMAYLDKYTRMCYVDSCSSNGAGNGEGF